MICPTCGRTNCEEVADKSLLKFTIFDDEKVWYCYGCEEYIYEEDLLFEIYTVE